MELGDVVVARCDVEEEGFIRAGVLYVHAKAGERGRVVAILEDGWCMVEWERTETTAQVDVSEISPLEAAQPAA